MEPEMTQEESQDLAAGKKSLLVFWLRMVGWVLTGTVAPITTFAIKFGLFTEYGYNITYKVVNTANYGVPQIRERFICVGVRKDFGKPFVFPEETHYNPEKATEEEPNQELEEAKAKIADLEKQLQAKVLALKNIESKVVALKADPAPSGEEGAKTRKLNEYLK